jgi:serine/threonine-protein kinase
MDEDSLTRAARRRVGRVVSGKWRLDRLLGVGGMAAVYEATHRNGKRVAVKMLHPALSAEGEVRGRFLREGYAANAVQHSGVVSVLDDDVSAEGEAFLVMDLLDGETLDARWTRYGRRLPPGEVLAVAEGVLDALCAAHAAGVVHRDIKPENIFVTRDGAVKLLDFGIAHVREVSSQDRRTQAGLTMGTPSFMPPEQARGRWNEVDGRSDVWATGAVMFCMLTGQVVHDGQTANEVLLAAMTRPAPALLAVRPDVTPLLASIVDRALAFEPGARWPDAAAMLTAVRQASAAGAGCLVPSGSPSAPPGGHATAASDARFETRLGCVWSVSEALRTARAPRRILGGGAALAVAALAVVAFIRPVQPPSVQSAISAGEGAAWVATPTAPTAAVSAAALPGVDAGEAPALPTPSVSAPPKRTTPRPARTAATPPSARPAALSLPSGGDPLGRRR